METQIFKKYQCPLVAEGRSPMRAFQCLLTRKQTIELGNQGWLTIGN